MLCSLAWSNRPWTTFLFVASQLGREEIRVANENRPGAYASLRRLPPHGRSPSRSCLRLVLPLQGESFGILTPESFQSRTGDFHPTTSRPCRAYTKKSTRVADRAFSYIKVSWRQPGDFGRYLAPRGCHWGSALAGASGFDWHQNPTPTASHRKRVNGRADWNASIDSFTKSGELTAGSARFWMPMKSLRFRSSMKG